MADLKPTDTLFLEKFLDYKSGYVLDFSNNTFQQHILNAVGIDIYVEKYEKYGESKGKRLMAFLELEDNETVGALLDSFIEYYVTKSIIDERELSKSEEKLIEECEKIVERLKDQALVEGEVKVNDEEFLNKEIEVVDLSSLKIETEMVKVLDSRINEIQKSLRVGNYLSSVIICGSTLEGIIQGLAKNNLEEFMTAKSSPKKQDGGTKPLYQWSLFELINVAYELGFIGLDVKKYSHSLRDFRNFIHPEEQLKNKFNPRKQTAEISFQVLKAAIHDISECLKK